MTYYSQAGQDKWVHDIIGDKGFFVDIGAYDGVQTSNTYALEQAGWNGICVEAEVNAFDKCAVTRCCRSINKAVTNYKGIAMFAGDRIGGSISVPCDTLQGILRDNAAPKLIDYLSMDIEGHELIVLENFPFDEFQFKLITIEHNLYCDGPEKKNALYELLTRNGYTRVVDNAPCLDPNPAWYMQPYEDWYRHNDFKI
jgi:hypothetical protein